MILCLLNWYIYILLFRGEGSSMKGPVNALRRGFPLSCCFTGSLFVKTWKRMAKQRIVKPPFWCWSWGLCHLYLHLVGTCQQIDLLTWLLPQEHYYGATSNTGILNPVRYRKEGISHKDHIFILFPPGFSRL